MIGCGLQLDDHGEYSWRETTATLSLNKEEVKLFLEIEKISYSHHPSGGSLVRVSLLQMKEYIEYFPSIQEFLLNHRKNRFLRLGRRSRLPAWELDSHDAYLINMRDSDFENHYIADPRGQLSFAQSLNAQAYLHEPFMKTIPQGLPSPGESGWIRLISSARNLEPSSV